jgi:hypothetical protein
MVAHVSRPIVTRKRETLTSAGTGIGDGLLCISFHSISTEHLTSSREGFLGLSIHLRSFRFPRGLELQAPFVLIIEEREETRKGENKNC